MTKFNGGYSDTAAYDKLCAWNNKTGAVKLAASGKGFGDKDLQGLFAYLGTGVKEFTSWCKSDKERHDGNSYGIYIDLSHNNVSDQALEKWVGPFLAKWPVCQKLKLSGNANVSDRGLRALEKYLQHGFCEKLFLTDLPAVSDYGIQGIVRAAIESKEYPHGDRAEGWYPLQIHTSAAPDVGSWAPQLIGKIEVNGSVPATSGDCCVTVFTSNTPRLGGGGAPSAAQQQRSAGAGGAGQHPSASSSGGGGPPGGKAGANNSKGGKGPVAGGGAAAAAAPAGTWAERTNGTFGKPRTPDLHAESSFPSLDAAAGKVKTSNTLGLQGLVRWGQAPDSVFAKAGAKAGGSAALQHPPGGPPTAPPPKGASKGGKDKDHREPQYFYDHQHEQQQEHYGKGQHPHPGGKSLSRSPQPGPPGGPPPPASPQPPYSSNNHPRGQPQPQPQHPHSHSPYGHNNNSHHVPSEQPPPLPIWVREERWFRSSEGRLLPVEEELLQVNQTLQDMLNYAGMYAGGGGAAAAASEEERRLLRRRIAVLEDRAKREGGRTLQSLLRYGFNAGEYFAGRRNAVRKIWAIYLGIVVRRRWSRVVADRVAESKRRRMAEAQRREEDRRRKEAELAAAAQKGAYYSSGMGMGAGGAKGQIPGKDAYYASPAIGAQQYAQQAYNIPGPGAGYNNAPGHPQQQHSSLSPTAHPYHPAPRGGQQQYPTSYSSPPPPTHQQFAPPPPPPHLLTQNWYYLGNDGSQQGPYSHQRMRNWFLGRYFKPDLLIRCEGIADFHELQILFPNGHHEGGNAFDSEPVVPGGHSAMRSRSPGPPPVGPTPPAADVKLESKLSSRNGDGEQDSSAEEAFRFGEAIAAQFEQLPTENARQASSPTLEQGRGGASVPAQPLPQEQPAAAPPYQPAPTSASAGPALASAVPRGIMNVPAPVNPGKREDSEDMDWRKGRSGGRGDKIGGRNKAGLGLDDDDLDSMSDDHGEEKQQIFMVEPKYVGLVIGKAGDTIKKVKNQTGCIVNIDQDVPAGIPRAVIMKGTRKQIKAAERMIKSLIQKAKEEESGRSGSGLGSGLGHSGGGKYIPSLAGGGVVAAGAGTGSGLLDRAGSSTLGDRILSSNVPDSALHSRTLTRNDSDSHSGVAPLRGTNTRFNALDPTSSSLSGGVGGRENNLMNRGEGGGRNILGDKDVGGRAAGLRSPNKRMQGGGVGADNWRGATKEKSDATGSDAERLLASVRPSKQPSHESKQSIYDLMSQKPSWAQEKKSESENTYLRGDLLYYREQLGKAVGFEFDPPRYRVQDRPIKKTPKKRIDSGITLDDAPEASKEGIYEEESLHEN